MGGRALDVNTVVERVAGLLLDPERVKYGEAEVLAGLRLALGELSLRAGEPYALAGLDGVTETTLPATLETLLVIRAGARADWELQDEGEFQRLQSWAEGRLGDFRKVMGTLFPANVPRVRDQHRSQAPWAAWHGALGEEEKGNL
jgi:hypothetical protein